MQLKKFAVRGLIVLAVVVALCLFFSGTVRTITTPKIKLTNGRYGRLEEKVELSGKLVWPESEAVRLTPGEGRTIRVDKVNTRAGYTVAAGDVLLECSVVDYDNAMKNYLDSYNDASGQLLALDSKYASLKLRKTDTQYADAYFALSDAREAALSAKITMDTLLARAGVSLPETGYPEEADDELRAAIDAWRNAADAQTTAQETYAQVQRYLPDDTTWTYITEKHTAQQKQETAQRGMDALSSLGGQVSAIVAPHDGYIVDLSLKEGDTYDGTSDLYRISVEGELPMIRCDVSSLTKTVSEGAQASVSTQRSGNVSTVVDSVGTDAENGKYVDVAVNSEIINGFGSVYAMSTAQLGVTLTFKAQQESTLLPAAAVHGTGESRSVFVVDTTYSGSGAAQMVVHKTDVTVLGEANGVVSVEEDLSYATLAYMEDRTIQDGDTVMEYIN